MVSDSEASMYRLEYTSLDAMTKLAGTGCAITTWVTVTNGVALPNFSFDQ